MPIPIEYTVDDVIAMLKNDKSFGGANIYMSTDWSIIQWCTASVKNLVPLTIFLAISWRQRVNQQYWGDLISVKNGGYEQPEVTSEDTSEDTTASADADVTRSAASLAMTSLLVHHAGRK